MKGRLLWTLEAHNGVTLSGEAEFESLSDLGAWVSHLSIRARETDSALRVGIAARFARGRSATIAQAARKRLG